MTTIMAIEKKHTPICSTKYMNETLKYFNKEDMFFWYQKVKEIDNIISLDIENNYNLIEKNNTKLTTDLISKLTEKIKLTNINFQYNLKNIEVFHGYIYYAYPDNGLIIKKSKNPDLNYGIAKAILQGLPHRHFKSPAFNYILEGEGVFTGDPYEKGMFNSFYHGNKLVKDVEIEIPVGMTHGHLVKKGSVIWFMAVQKCGFARDKACAGDFYKLPEYDNSIFGVEYQ